MAALPTSLDAIYAYMYARDRLVKETCNAPETKKKYPGTLWTSKNPAPYPCPPGLDCDHGNCAIVTEDECKNQSQVPWGPGGEELATVECKKDEDCKNSAFEAVCSKAHGKCVPKKAYLEWHPNSSGTGPGGMCQYGNFALRKWCEYPATRSTSSVNGMTNVPPFDYKPETGKCEITKDYCDWMEVSFKHDSQNRPTCYLKTGQKIGEFIMGKTIFRAFKKDDNKDNEDYQPPRQSLMSGFNKLGHVQKLADTKYIQDKNLVSKDFGGPGIHLYHIAWKPSAMEKDKGTVKDGMGMLAKEVKKVYPEAVTKIDGDMYISISRDQVRKNPKLKRIYLASSSGNWMLKSFMNLFNAMNKKK